MFGITAQAAEQEEGLEDLSGIQMQPWMREGVPAELGVLPQTQEDQKIVSILSDSLGTYEGFTPWTAFYYYYCSQYMDVSETWWMRYIESNGMRLGVNESLGGSKVAWQEGDPTGYNSQQCMAAEERIARLDDNGTPDVILFFGGTNDIANTELGEFLPGENIGEISDFSCAYQTALVRLKEYYPEAEIICMTPYYCDISFWAGSTNEDVDRYADRIVEICDFYGVRCVDLRMAELDDREDMCGWDYLHVNEQGAYKIWHMLQYGQPALASGEIRILQNCDKLIRAEYQAAGQSDSTEYQWQIYDCAAGVWIFASEWSKENTFTYEPEVSGNYWLYCAARDATGGSISSCVGISVVISPLSIEGLGWIHQEDEIQIGVAYSPAGYTPLIRWLAYDLDAETWSLISDWSPGNWSSWQPKKGNYWLHVELQDSSGRIISNTINFAVDRNYPVYITGKYQGPDPGGNGWLIGVSSNINPQQQYRYELLILDCDKYAAGDPNPWIYGTSPQTVAEGSTFWTTWQPPHRGNYWTYFRIYDGNGQLVEDQCYGVSF